jgi:hypothetical protein
VRRPADLLAHAFLAGATTLACLGLAGPASDVGAQQPVSLEGVWRSGGTSIPITVKGTEARGTFVELSPDARSLGFKPGELSFVGTVAENYLHGVQTIRYAGTCHPNGRKVAFIGRVTPNGQTLATHNYGITVDNNCRDTGEYRLNETIWQRAPAR